MKRMLKKLSGFVLLLLVTLSFNAFAGQALLIGIVTEFLFQEGAYGECMVKLEYNGATVNPNGELSGCANFWTSLGCSGEYHSKSFAQNMLSTAQLSLVSGNRIGVYIDDTKKYNGYCVAYRIDAVNEP